MIQNPVEWHAFADAIIRRGEVERRLGVESRYGQMSSVHGTNVRFWPVVAVEELAWVEYTVLTTQTALRRAQGLST